MKNLLNRFLQSQNNAPNAAYLLTSLLGANITAGTIKADLEKHPGFPSLLSISDVFNSHHIDNLSLRIDAGKLTELSPPFLTQLKGKDLTTDYFTVVRKIGESGIEYYDPEAQRWRTGPVREFLSRWSGIVLLAEVGEGTDEPDYPEKVKAETRERILQSSIALCFPAVVILAACMAIFSSGRSAVLPFLYAVFTLAGCILSFFLMWFDYDRYNPLLRQICGGEQISKTNCNAVLQSEGSKIWGISWSSIGFSYFSGLLLIQLMQGFTNPEALYIMGWFSMIALPYVIYSLYYQWKIARHWCTLCLMIQCIIVLQAGIMYAGRWDALLTLTDVQMAVVPRLMTAFALPFMIVSVLFPLLRTRKEKHYSYLELQRIKHDPQIFRAMLAKQPFLAEAPAGLGISLGHAEAAYKIIKVCNPYCNPCAIAHLPVEKLLEENPNVSLQVIFTAIDSENDSRALPVKHLMAIQGQNKPGLAKKALHDWYTASEKDYQAFADKYPLNGELKQQGAKLSAMDHWCKQTRIAYTPTFFVALTGEEETSSRYYQLPEVYHIGDLKYLLSV